MSTDFICFAGVDWWYHNRAHSDLQLMRHLAADHTVLVVNSIGLRTPVPGRSTQLWRSVGRKLRSTAKLLRRPIPDLPRFHVLSPVFFPCHGRSRAWQLSAALIRSQVRAAARWVGIRTPWIVVTPPTAWDVVRPMRRRGLVYNRSDLHSEFPEGDRDYLRELESELLAKADRILYVNRDLMQREAAKTGGRAYFLDHGVDLELFDPSRIGEEPEDLRSIPRPRIGFLGKVRGHLVDLPLLERIAEELSQAHLVLVGDTTSDIGALLRRRNVHWLGHKQYEDVPRYGAGLDVGLLPYRDTPWIRSCNPIKLKEYLALGLAVVATDFPAAREHANLIEVASDAGDFVARVRHALAATGDAAAHAARRRSVLASSWAAKAAELARLCAGEEVEASA